MKTVLCITLAACMYFAILPSCRQKTSAQEPVMELLPDDEGMYEIATTIFLPEVADSVQWSWRWDGESLHVSDTVTMAIIAGDELLSWKYVVPGTLLEGHALKAYSAVIRRIEEYNPDPPVK